MPSAAYQLSAIMRVQLEDSQVKQVAARLKQQLGAAAGSIPVDVRLSGAGLSTVKGLSGALQSSATAAGSFGSALGGVAGKIAAVALAGVGLVSVGRALRAGASEAVALQDSMTRLAAATGESGAAIRATGSDLARLAATYGVSSGKLADAAITLRSAGLSAEQAKSALEAIAKANLAGGFKDTGAAADALLNSFQQFNKNAGDSQAILGTLSALAKTYGVASDELSAALKKSGAVASAGGASFEELSAVIAGTAAVTRQSADEVASGLALIFGRIQRPEVIDALESLNVRLRTTRQEAELLGNANLEGRFIGIGEGLRRVAAETARLPTGDARRQAILEAAGGARGANRVPALLQSVGSGAGDKALNIARLGGGGLDAAAERRAESLAVKLAQAREEITKLLYDIGNTPAFRLLADGLSKGVSLAVGLADSLRGVLPILASIAAYKLLAPRLSGLVAGVAGKPAASGATLLPGPAKTLPASAITTIRPEPRAAPGGLDAAASLHQDKTLYHAVRRQRLERQYGSTDDLAERARFIKDARDSGQTVTLADYFRDRDPSALERFRKSRPTLLGRARAFGERVTRPVGGLANAAGLGAAVGGGFLSDALSPAPSDLQAVGEGRQSEARYGGRSVLSGLAGGAASGAVVGSFVPVIGTAVGALVGAAAGMTAAFLTARKEIEEAKFGAAVNRLGENLNQISQGAALAANVQGESLRDISAIRAKAEGEGKSAGSTFFGLGPTDYKAAGDVRQRSLRSSLGGQIAPIAGAITKETERLAGENPAAPARDVLAKLNSGLTGELLRLSADIRGVPLAKVLQETADSIANVQRRNAAQSAARQGALESESVLHSFTRLATVTEDAAAAMERLDGRMQTLSSVFSGQGGAGPVARNSAALQSAPGEFFGTVGRAFGPSLRQDAQTRFHALRDVKDLLPSALARVSAEPENSQRPAGLLVRDEIERSLGKERANLPQVRSVLTTLSGKLGEHEETPDGRRRLAESIKADPGKAAADLLKGLEEPLTALQRAIENIESASNRYVSGLNDARAKTVQLGESFDRVADTRLEGHRIGANLAAERSGGLAADFLSLDQLRAPFRGRQERLTGIQGEDAENPALIAGRLRAVNDAIPTAERERDAAVGDPKKFDGAAKALDKLVGQSNNLARALHNLGDVSGRAAPLLQQLGAIQSDRNSRRSYVDKFIFASDEEKFSLRRGQGLAAQFDRGQINAGALSTPDLQLLLSTLKDLGETKLASGKRASERANEIRDQFGAALPPGAAADEANLTAQLENVLKSGTDAMTEAANIQKAGFDRFAAALDKNLAALTAYLSAQSNQQKLSQALSDKAKADIRGDELKKQTGGRDVLAKVGITRQSDLEAARGQGKNLEKFFAADDATKGNIGEVFGKIKNSKSGAAGEFAAGLKKHYAGPLASGFLSDDDELTQTGLSATRSLLNDSGGLTNLPQADQESVIANVYQKSLVLASAKNKEAAEARGISRNKLSADTLGQNFQDSVARVGFDEIRDVNTARAPELRRQRDEAAEQLNRGQIKSADVQGLSGSERATLTDTLANGFKEAGQPLNDFGRQVAANAAELAKLQAAVEAARSAVAVPAIPGPVQTRAAGGPVFPGRPSGTDIAPVWATPGEFVVNRKSVAANRPLVEAINRAKGPLHLADGGDVLDALDRQRRDDRLAQAIAAADVSAQSYRPTAPQLRPEKLFYGPLPANIDFRGATTPTVYGDLPVTADPYADLPVIRRKGRRRPLYAGPQTADDALALNAAASQAAIRGADRPGEAGQAAIAAGAFGSERAGLFKALYEDRSRRANEAAAARSVRPAAAPRREPIDQLRRRLRGQADIFQRPFAIGGAVPGPTGAGDSVGAILAPGEFVMRRSAVQAIGVNRLARWNRFADGGAVGGGGGLTKGGGAGEFSLSEVSVKAFEQFVTTSGNLSATMGGFTTSSDRLSQAMTQFNTNSAALADALLKFPSSLKLEGRQEVFVTHNGLEIAQEMNATVGQLIDERVADALAKTFKHKLPDA